MEEENDSNVFINVATGALIGLAVGGILGLLFAPKPGAEFREDIKDRTEEAMDRLQDATGELVARSKELAAHTKENLTHSLEVGKTAYVHKRDELMAQLDA